MYLADYSGLLKKDIDIDICLSYPLASAPSTLCQCSGEMHTTDKLVLSTILRSRTTSFPPSFIDITDVIDRTFLTGTFGHQSKIGHEKIEERLLYRIQSLALIKLDQMIS